MYIELHDGRQIGREGDRKGPSKDRRLEDSKGRGRGSDDVRERGSESGGRDEGLRKGTSKEGTWA